MTLDLDRTVGGALDAEKSTHKLYPWVTVYKDAQGKQHAIKKGDEHREMQPADVVELNGVPQNILLNFVDSELQNEASFMSLPAAMLLILIYGFCFIEHDKADTVLNVQDAVTFDIWENANFAFSAPGDMGFKSIYDVNSYPDFYSWLKIGLLPLIMPPQVQYSEDFNYTRAAEMASERPSLEQQRSYDFWRSELGTARCGASGPCVPDEEETLQSVPGANMRRNYFLHYNKLFLGIRLTQTRAPINSCGEGKLSGDPSRLIAAFSNCTFAEFGSSLSNLHRRPEITRLKNGHGETDQPDPAKTRWFLLGNTQNTQETLISNLEKEAWLDRRTVKIEATFMTYNGYFDLLTLSSVVLLQSRSGHFCKVIYHRSTVLSVYESGNTNKYLVIAMDVLFVSQITWIMLNELKDVAKSIHHAYKTGHGLGFFLKSYLGFWNCVDWVSIIYAYLLIAFWGTVLSHNWQSSEELEQLEISMREAGQDFPTADIEKVWMKFEERAFFFFNCRWIASGYPFVIMLRLFKAFSVQPRLALVTRTLQSGAMDIAHFGLVFAAIFFTYALMGVAVFGRDLNEFSTVLHSVDSCFQVLMGDFNITEMYESGRFTTMIWFTSFMGLVNLVMLNMLLAIIMDTYAEVKGKISETKTLFQQAAEMYRRWAQKRRGERISLDTVRSDFIAAFGPEAHLVETIVDVDTFTQTVRTISRLQAFRLLHSSVEDVCKQAKSESGISLSEGYGMIDSIHRGTEILSTIMSRKLDAGRDSVNLGHPGGGERASLGGGALTPITSRGGDSSRASPQSLGRLPLEHGAYNSPAIPSGWPGAGPGMRGAGPAQDPWSQPSGSWATSGMGQRGLQKSPSWQASQPWQASSPGSYGAGPTSTGGYGAGSYGAGPNGFDANHLDARTVSPWQGGPANGSQASPWDSMGGTGAYRAGPGVDSANGYGGYAAVPGPYAGGAYGGMPGAHAGGSSAFGSSPGAYGGFGGPNGGATTPPYGGGSTPFSMPRTACEYDVLPVEINEPLFMGEGSTICDPLMTMNLAQSYSVDVLIRAAQLRVVATAHSRRTPSVQSIASLLCPWIESLTQAWTQAQNHPALEGGGREGNGADSLSLSGLFAPQPGGRTGVHC